MVQQLWNEKESLGGNYAKETRRVFDKDLFIPDKSQSILKYAISTITISTDSLLTTYPQITNSQPTVGQLSVNSRWR